MSINFDMMSDAEINALDSDTFGDAIFDLELKSPAIISEAEIDDLEEAIRSDSFVYARRGALALLKETGAHTIDAVAKDRPTAVAFADLNERIIAYRKALTYLLDLVRRSEARLLVALANRTDMDEIIAEAKGGNRSKPTLRIV